MHTTYSWTPYTHGSAHHILIDFKKKSDMEQMSECQCFKWRVLSTRRRNVCLARHSCLLLRNFAREVFPCVFCPQTDWRTGESHAVSSVRVVVLGAARLGTGPLMRCCATHKPAACMHCTCRQIPRPTFVLATNACSVPSAATRTRSTSLYSSSASLCLPCPCRMRPMLHKQGH